MRILITSSGNLAPLLYATLKQQGHDVRVMRRRPDPAFGGDCVIGDAGKLDDVRAAMAGCDRVIHTAVRNNFDMTLDHYQEFLQSNVVGTFNVMQAAAELGTPRVVNASTSMVLGFQRWHQQAPPNGVAVRIHDDVPHHSTCIYSMTKSLAEQAVDFFREHHGVNVASLRFGWLAPLRLYADVKMLYRTLSFCFHPQDAAAAVLAALDSAQQGNYLIAAPMPWSEADGEALWRDPRALLAARFGHELEYLERRQCPIAPIACWLDSSRAQRDLGYRPRYDFRWYVRQHEAGAFAGSARDEAVHP